MNVQNVVFRSEAMGSGQPAVLVADDDPTSRLLVTAALEGNFGVTEAENGLVAVEAAERQGFDLAILDLDMPVMDGFGVIERLRARAETRHLPIIVVTGRDDVVAIERAFALGATSFLCKPINWNIFRHQVGYVLQVARLDRDNRSAKEEAERAASCRERSMAALEAEVARSLAKLGAFLVGPAAQFPELTEVSARLSHVLARVKRASEILTGAVLPESRPVLATDLVEAALGKIRHRMGAAATDRVTVATESNLKVRCDPELAADALVEVLGNALTYSRPGTEVKLGIHDAPPGRVRFEIEDRGPGIPEAVLDSGFEACPGSATGPRGNVGLGLAVSKKIVELEGGHFGIMSELGRGTEVFFSFPTPVDFRLPDKSMADPVEERR